MAKKQKKQKQIQRQTSIGKVYKYRDIELINYNMFKEQILKRLIEVHNRMKYDSNKIHLSINIDDLTEQYLDSLEDIEKPQIYITLEAYTKMRLLVNKLDTEVGWYGLVEKHSTEKKYVIKDILVYPQQVSGATCTQDEDEMFNFEMSLTDEQVNQKRFQGHSHVNMGVSPSGVDETFYEELLTQVTDYFIVMITNKKEENHIRFYDVEDNIMYKDLTLNIITNEENLTDWYYTQTAVLNKPKPRTVGAVTTLTNSEQMGYDFWEDSYLEDYYSQRWYGRSYIDDEDKKTTFGDRF